MLDAYHQTLILFNGPPGCGKDTAADIVANLSKREVYQTKFARAMKLNVLAALGFEPDLGIFERLKDSELDRFGGKTLRQIVIAYSEEFAKPNFGQDFFGRLTTDEVLHRLYDGDEMRTSVPTIVTVSDSGFPIEGMTLVRATSPSFDEYVWDRVVLIRLHRDGCNFDKDSRSYWSLAEQGFTRGEEYDVLNNGTVLDLEKRLAQILPEVVTLPTYQLQVQLPTDPIGEPAWGVFRNDVADLDKALALTETARKTAYGNRVLRIVRTGRKPQVLKVVFPGDAPCYSFEPAQQPQVENVTP